jgi:hypothetical protein
MRPSLTVLALLLCACGAKSPLRIPVPVDATVDGGTDGGPPAQCLELPLNAPPRDLPVDFVAQILSADVLFLVDVTGSMGEEIGQIRDFLRDEIAPGLAAQIPDLQMAVAHFADFPLPDENYGEEEDDLFRLLQISINDIASVQQAVDRLPLQGGRDGPEAMVEALYLSATGEGMGAFAQPARCAPGTAGAACFRRSGTRIVLTFSDAPSHQGPGDHDMYRRGSITPPPHNYDQTLAALRSIGAKVIGLYSGEVSGDGRRDLERIALDTGAATAGGTPLVFDIGTNGGFLAASVIEGTRTLVDEVPIDLDLVVEDVEGDAFDTTRFVTEIVAVSATPRDGATIVGDRFDNVRPGTRIAFSIRLANQLVPQTSVPQEFLMRVVLRGDSVTRLRENLVRIIVPPIGGGRVCQP